MPDGKECVNFGSNDYLGLATDKNVVKAVGEYTETYGTGARSSRLVTGTQKYHNQLEQQLAEWVNKEAALLYGSESELYTLLIPLLTDKRTVIFADSNISDNLLQGCLSSEGSLERYHHNELKHLEIQLKKSSTANNRLFIITESVFRTGGDVTPVDELAEIAERYNAMLIVDESHALGIFGEQGSGVASGSENADIIIGSLSNTLAGFGAFIACRQVIRNFLLNYSPGFHYTPALPPSVAGGAIKALELCKGMDSDREKLLELSDRLRNGIIKAGFDIPEQGSQIVPLPTGDEQQTRETISYLRDHGFLATPVIPDEEGFNQSKILFSLSSHHRKKDIDELLKVINKVELQEKDQGA